MRKGKGDALIDKLVAADVELRGFAVDLLKDVRGNPQGDDFLFRLLRRKLFQKITALLANCILFWYNKIYSKIDIKIRIQKGEGSNGKAGAGYKNSPSLGGGGGPDRLLPRGGGVPAGDLSLPGFVPGLSPVAAGARISLAIILFLDKKL